MARNRIFIAGETIDLCVPTDEDLDVWAAWFNDPYITRFLEQGKYPNSPALQRQFLDKAVESGRFMTMIKTKDGRLLGVVSLSEIDSEKRTAQLSYVCPVKDNSSRYAPLEAAAHCSQHAFERFAVEKVWAGHAFPGLQSWAKKKEVIGFLAEGVLEDGFRNGQFVSDSVRTALTLDRFEQLKSQRSGRLWPGQAVVSQLLEVMSGLPSLAESVSQSVKDLQAERFRLLCNAESKAPDGGF